MDKKNNTTYLIAGAMIVAGFAGVAYGITALWGMPVAAIIVGCTLIAWGIATASMLAEREKKEKKS